MIIGNGDIASALPEREDLLFFASGVSNSWEDEDRPYLREAKLLLAQDPEQHIVYFSSLGVITGAPSQYLEHKRYMEVLVKENFPMHTIIRIGNIDWGTNPHTLINYLRAHPDAEIKDEYRYIVDKDEFQYWVSQIPDWPCEMNVPGRRLKVKQIVKEYVDATK